MNTEYVINKLQDFFINKDKYRITNKFVASLRKVKPFEGDVDILAQRKSIIYCFEIKELNKWKIKEVFDGIDQLKGDRNYIILKRKYLVEETSKIMDFSTIKLILIVIIAGEGSVYLFGNSIGENKQLALAKITPLKFEVFLVNIGKYLSF